MKYTKTLSIAMVLSLMLITTAQAQSEEEDPLGGIDDIIAEIEALEEEEFPEAGSETLEENPTAEDAEFSDELSENMEESTGESAEELSSEIVDTAKEELNKKLASNRFEIREIPEGKENHVLYKVPGAMDYKGMTFLKLSSAKFLNRFLRCETTEEQSTYNALARLKISQGAPLECRESMSFEIMPYRSVYRNR